MSTSSFSCFLVTEVVHKNMHMPIFIVPLPSEAIGGSGRESCIAILVIPNLEIWSSQMHFGGSHQCKRLQGEMDRNA